MIEEVRISDLGVIEEAQLSLHPGFNVVTGETGAGKTMVVTALGLLLGARAESSAVRRGAERAQVDAVLEVRGDHPAVTRAQAAGAWIGTEDDEEDDEAHAAERDERAGREVDLLLGRTVSAKGRSRASVSGRAVPVSVLGEVGSALVTVHGQTDQLRLKSAAAQRRALDSYAGEEFGELLAAYREEYREYRATRAAWEEITTSERERRLEAEQLQQALEQIDEVDPRCGEEEELKAEAIKLENVESLRGAARTAATALSGPDMAEGFDDAAHAVELVEQARTALGAVSEQDAELADLAARLDTVSALLNDAAGQLSGYASGLDESVPERLSAVHQRRADLDRLTRLYGADVDAVIAWAETSRARLMTLQSDEDRIESLAAEVRAAEERLRTQAAELRRRRAQAGELLAEAVGAELAALSMPHARMVVEVTQTQDLGPDGADTVAMLLAPHAGADPMPLGRGASGGELSRVMLAIEVVLAAYDAADTFIFDEVDVGVGGRAAVQIGRRLAMLAEHVQVIVVTHLPQVAAFAQHHIRVFKSSVADDSAAGGFTASDVGALNPEQRVEELARMLAGQEDSASARAHARELIADASAR